MYTSLVELVDLILGYDCDYCTITPAMRTRALTPKQVLEALQLGRERGFGT